MKPQSIILCLLLFVVACSKEDTHRVRIRIANSSATPATDAKLGSEAYGTLQPGQTSAYHSFTNLRYIPLLTFTADTTLVSLESVYGRTGASTGPTYIANGDYLYTIKADTAAYYGFSYAIVKENK